MKSWASTETIFDVRIYIFPERNMLTFVESFLFCEIVSVYEIEGFKKGEEPIKQIVDGDDNEN